MRNVRAKKVTVFYTPSFRNFISYTPLSPEKLVPLMSKLGGFISFVGDICVLGSTSALQWGSVTSKGIIDDLIPDFVGRLKDHALALRIGDASRVEIRVKHKHESNMLDPDDAERFTIEAMFFKEGKTKLALIDMTFTLSGHCCAAGLVATDYL